jgi:hypothetical protein
MLSRVRQERAVGEARALLGRYWRARAELWPEPPRDASAMVPIDLDRLVRGLLGLDLLEPEEVNSGVSTSSSPPDHEVAGLLDRAGRRIVIAQKFPPECRRFTTAHEIAHYVLHPELVLHRERPLFGGEQSRTYGRPAHEEDADVFAAALLMPERILAAEFLARFGQSLRLSLVDETLAFRLSTGLKGKVQARDIHRKGSRYLALLAAMTTSFGESQFTSLTERFGVSATAMAIQLEEGRYVIN